MLLELLALIVIIWLAVRASRKDKSRPPVETSSDQISRRDLEWRDYIASFKQGAGAKESELVQHILMDNNAPDWKGETKAAVAKPVPAKVAASETDSKPAIAEVGFSTQPHRVAIPSPAVEAPPKELDGTLLLLYFGAFLFVAAAGLFVAFGGFEGNIRTLLVVLAMMVLYLGGFWIYGLSKRLQPAGVAFVAIGMAIAPLVGVAAWYFITSGTHAPAIWLLTSLLCLSMYAYALYRLKTAFISYLLIFSFISLFESAVAVLDGSAQYYVWVLILVGMALRFLGVVRENPQLERPAAVSAQIIIPLSIAVSLWLLTTRGVGQLGVTLLLSALYYTLEAVQQKAGENRVNFVLGAHVLYLLGIVALVFNYTESGKALAVTLLIITLIHGIVIERLSRDSEIAKNFATIAVVSAVPAVVLGYPDGVLMSASLAVIACLGVIIATHQKRADAFVCGALAFVLLPFAVGQFLFDPNLGAAPQTLLAAVPFLTLWGVWNYVRSEIVGDDWRDAAASVYVIAGLAFIGTAALYEPGWLFIAACSVFALTMVQLARRDAGASWWVAAGLLFGLPVAREFFVSIGEPAFSVAVLLALLANIFITLRSRSEGNRWLVAILGMALPLAVGAGGLGWTWTWEGYIYGYLFVMAGLILCRAIALGVLFMSSKIPVLSYYRSTSAAYVAGYIAAAMVALGLSLWSPDSQVHTSVVLALLVPTILLLAITVEKSKNLLGLLPWLTIALLLSLFRSDISEPASNLLLPIISVVIIGYYGLFKSLRNYLDKDADEVVDATWPLIYLPVLLCLGYDTSDILPPLLLGIAGAVTLHRTWLRNQSERELAGGVIVLSLMWALYVYDVRNIQAYTHVLAALFAGYAYWRHRRADRAGSDSYLYAMLATATVPLVLQALGGSAGGVYGWWLLLEQVGFLILGILIGRKFVTFWGLYVAIGAVLYQLRHLGWAALSLLALFIIGVAIYRLMKRADKD